MPTLSADTVVAVDGRHNWNGAHMTHLVMYVCLFTLDPVGPMILPNVHEQYIYSS